MTFHIINMLSIIEYEIFLLHINNTKHFLYRSSKITSISNISDEIQNSNSDLSSEVPAVPPYYKM